MFTIGDVALPWSSSDFCLFKISSSKQSCRKVSHLVGAVQHQRGELHHVHHGPNPGQPSLSPSGFTSSGQDPSTLTCFFLFWSWSEAVRLECEFSTYWASHSIFFPQGRLRLHVSKGVAYTLHLTQASTATERGIVDGFILPWPFPPPKVGFNPWKLISWLP